MLRLQDNPVARFPAGRPLVDDCGRWSVAHVRPRQEKALAKDLQKRGISYFLPLMERCNRRRDNGKIRKSIVPLFPGYLSFACEPEKRGQMFGTHRVVHVLEVGDQENFVRQCSMVQETLRRGGKVDLWVDAEPGAPVLVVRGPLAGISGEMVQREDKLHLIVRVDMLGQAVSVRVGEADVDPL